MVSRAPPVIAPPSVFRPDWKTLSRLASTWSKPLDLNTCPAPTSLHRFYDATDKLKHTWFWEPNQKTVAVILKPKLPNWICQFWGPNRKTLHHLGFEAQPRNPLPVLRPNRDKPSPPVLRSNWRKPSPLVLRPNWRKPWPRAAPRTVYLGRAWIRPSCTRLNFINFWFIQFFVNSKICLGFIWTRKIMKQILLERFTYVL
jgi:hypothetical protein